MWSKLTSVLKPRPVLPTQQEEGSSGETLHNERHPNLSVFNPGDNQNQDQPPAPESTTKRSVFKRLSRQALNDGESSKSVSSLRGPGLPKKIRPRPDFNTVSSSALVVPKVLGAYRLTRIFSLTAVP
jgi:hypothetical protein